MKLLTSGYQLCYECHRRIIPVVEIGTMDENGHIDQEGGGTFCLACLRKAVVLLETILAPTQESPQHPRPGDFVAGEGHPHAAPGADAMNPQYYEDYFSRARRNDAPDPVATAISGIFNLLEQMANALDALEARVVALEAATAPAPQEEPTP